MSARLLLVAIAFAAVSTLATSVHAQSRPSAADREARALFEQGLEAAEGQRWADALELFRRSRSVVERPSVLYNEAQVLVRLGRFVEARDALRAFQSAAGGGSSDTDRARIERAAELMREVDGQIARLVLRVDPANASVEIDGEASALSGPVRTLELDPGRHAISVRAEGRDSRSFSVAVLSGTRSAETVTLPESSTTRLLVESGEQSARIEVDGEVIGTGRAEAGVRGGRHVIRVVPEAGVAREREVEIAAGTTLSVDLGPSSVSGASDDLWITLGIALGVTALIGVGVAVGVAVYDPGVEAPIAGDVGPGGIVSALTVSF